MHGMQIFKISELCRSAIGHNDDSSAREAFAMLGSPLKSGSVSQVKTMLWIFPTLSVLILRGVSMDYFRMLIHKPLHTKNVLDAFPM